MRSSRLKEPLAVAEPVPALVALLPERLVSLLPSVELRRLSRALRVLESKSQLVHRALEVVKAEFSLVDW